MMRGMWIAIVSLMLLVPSAALAGNWYLGGGIDFVTPEGDTDFVDEGGGLVFDFGYRFTKVTALDITLAVSDHEENGYDIEYARFSVGPKFFFTDGKVQPFFTVGIMSHVMDYSNIFYEIEGTGLFLGFGADLYFDESNSLGIMGIGSGWDAEDNFGLGGDGETNLFRIVYNYHFK
jgi:hypothetical protein